MRYILLLIALSFLNKRSFAQSVINTTGNSSIINGYLHDYNVGEMIVTELFKDPVFITQGYLQPFYRFSDPFTSPDEVRVVNNYISPNNDGKNDLLKFEGLEKFPNNKLIIVDRVGRTMFSTTNYNNTWDGKLYGRKLAEDTYYWQLEYGDNKKLRGFVTITHDEY